MVDAVPLGVQHSRLLNRDNCERSDKIITPNSPKIPQALHTSCNGAATVTDSESENFSSSNPPQSSTDALPTSSSTNMCSIFDSVKLSTSNSSISDAASTTSSGISSSTNDGYSTMTSTLTASSTGPMSARRLAEAQAQSFRIELEELKKALSAVHQKPAEELPVLAEKLRGYNAQLSDLSQFLTARELGTLQVKIRELQAQLHSLSSKQYEQKQQQLQAEQQQQQPSQQQQKRPGGGGKFEFRRRAPPAATADKADTFATVPVPLPVITNIIPEPNTTVDAGDNKEQHFDVMDRHDESIDLLRGEVDQRDIVLKNLTKCTVKIFCSPSSLHVENITECTILCGPVRTSAFVSHASNSTFVVACQQLRIHSCRNVNFYISVGTHGGAIIEDTKDVRFASYSLQYPNVVDDFKAADYAALQSIFATKPTENTDGDNDNDEAKQMFAQLTRMQQTWQDIVDFDFPFSGSKSPNWTVVPESDRAGWNFV